MSKLPASQCSAVKLALMRFPGHRLLASRTWRSRGNKRAEGGPWGQRQLHRCAAKTSEEAVAKRNDKGETLEDGVRRLRQDKERLRLEAAILKGAGDFLRQGRRVDVNRQTTRPAQWPTNPHTQLSTFAQPASQLTSPATHAPTSRSVSWPSCAPQATLPSTDWQPLTFVGFSVAAPGEALSTSLEPTVGFEPTTCALRKHCSTTELSRRKEREDTRGAALVKGCRLW